MARARTRLPVPPRWRIDKATRRLASGRVLEAVIARWRFATETSPKPSNCRNPVEVELVDVGHIGQQAGFAEQPHRPLAEPLDVHGPTGREVADALHPLPRTVDVDAERVALAFKAHQLRLADRAPAREPPCGQAFGPQGQDRPDGLRG